MSITEIPAERRLDVPPDPLRLSPRERQLVRLVAQGRSNKEIATGLGLRLQTVKNHMSRVYKKMGISTRVELALFVVGSGLAQAD